MGNDGLIRNVLLYNDQRVAHESLQGDFLCIDGSEKRFIIIYCFGRFFTIINMTGSFVE